MIDDDDLKFCSSWLCILVEAFLKLLLSEYGHHGWIHVDRWFKTWQSSFLFRAIQSSVWEGLCRSWKNSRNLFSFTEEMNPCLQQYWPIGIFCWASRLGWKLAYGCYPLCIKCTLLILRICVKNDINPVNASRSCWCESVKFLSSLNFFVQQDVPQLLA